jgi:glucan phosphoethanolaminetransferase (alkaline phosphatase superfamily)
MVIGESLRGDMFYPNGKTTYDNAPNLMQLKNFISFQNATSSSTSTRLSLPYMMTRAVPTNWEQATSETSIISVFKKLGFKTAWIGAQGAFRTYDFTYGSIAMEADKTVIKSDIRKDSGQDNIYDEYLLLYLDHFIKDNPGENLFITLHMIGSHWIFDRRYPEAYKKFKPTCNSDSPSDCNKTQLLNSYHNSLLYSDWVLRQFINRFEDKKAFLLFASDHGYSLFESNYFGNAYEGKDELREQYDIAMFAWASDKYLQEFSGNYSKLKKKSKVSHDNLFHSLLGCINVKSDILEPNLNLCH